MSEQIKPPYQVLEQDGKPFFTNFGPIGDIKQRLQKTQLLLLCCYCHQAFRMLTAFPTEKRFLLACDVTCPHCHMGIIAGKELVVMPTEEQENQCS